MTLYPPLKPRAFKTKESLGAGLMMKKGARASLESEGALCSPDVFNWFC
ncbi:MAG TPA: hypothetical protein VGC66_20400 [Pyrinomonadaceae bacterium]|jgi:hypothetical protein